MKKRNILSLVLVGAMIIGSLSACGSSSTPAPAPAPASQAPASQAPASQAPVQAAPSQAPAAPVPDGGATGKLIIATENETPSMTVMAHNAVAGSYLNVLTHNGLFRTNYADLSPVPDLVESYKPLNDVEWEFKLREDIYFHNGDHMTAEDVAASLIFVKQWSERETSQKRIKAAEATGEYTVKITTTEPTSMLLNDLASAGNFIMPKALIDSGNDFNANPIGSGPYVFTNWTFGDSYSFEANDNYFDADRSARIKDLTWRIIPEGSSRTIALEAGEVDFVVEVATQDIPRMDSNPDITVFMMAGTSHNFMMINNEVSPFGELAVRKAIDMAIDKEAVVGVGLDGLATPIYSQVPLGFAGVSEEGMNTYDPEGALALLQEAGIDPSSIKFDIICSNDQKKRCGEVIQSNLLEIGINVTLSTMDLATYLSATAEGNFEAAIGGYTDSSLVSYLNGVWHGASINASNKSRTNLPEVNELIDKASAETNEAAQVSILEECTKLLNENCGQIPIYQANVIRAFSSKLVAPEFSASGSLNLNMISWDE